MTENLIPDFYHSITPTARQLEILNNLRKSKTITNFLLFKTKPSEISNTRRNYAGFIRDYFVEIDISDIEKYFEDPRLMENGKRVKYLDSIEENILKFNMSLQDQSGSNRKSKLSAIKKLLEYKKIDLGEGFWRDVKANGKKAFRQTETETPTKEQLRNILSRGSTEAKALFLTVMTSDSRIDSILKLTFNNLHLETNPPTIYIPPEDEKNEKAITKFISYEAKEWLGRYIEKDRKRILKTRINRTRTKQKHEDYENRVFPMCNTNAETIWKNLVEKELGEYKIDPKTKHPIMGIHSLRRYFEDNIGNGKLALYLANKVPKSIEPYQYKTKNKLTDEYIKQMKNILVLEQPIEDNPKFIENNLAKEKYKKTIEEKDKIIKQLQEREHIIALNTEAKEKTLSDFDERLKKLEKVSKIPRVPLDNKLVQENIKANLNYWKDEYKLSNKQVNNIKEELPDTYQQVNKALQREATEKGITELELILEYASSPEKCRELVQRVNPNIIKKTEKMRHKR